MGVSAPPLGAGGNFGRVFLGVTLGRRWYQYLVGVAWDATNHPTMGRTAPQHRIVRPNISIPLRWRSPAPGHSHGN